MFNSDFFHNAKDWFINNQRNLLLLLGFVIVGTLAFESGYLRGKTTQSAPLVVSIPAVSEPSSTSDVVNMSTAPQPGETKQLVSTVAGNQTTTSCPLVGSRNSNKYHVATCAVAKRIKPENRVCFSSKEDAEKRGYVAGCLK